MSEYQYDEFAAADRPLDDRELAAVRSLSIDAAAFVERIRELWATHARKVSFIDRLDRAGL